MKTFLQKELKKIEENGLYRQLRVIESVCGRKIKIGGKTYLNFSSNNYLGLAGHPKLKTAAKAAIEKYGTGSGASRLISGTLDLHRQLERELALFKGTEAALVFPSGYSTNLGTISTLVGEGDALIIDRFNHASLIDGCRLSKARLFVYPHQDMAGLKKILERTQNYRQRLIVTDSVFSMDGDLSPLPEIVKLARKYNAWTMIDEAHATGVFGKRGRGLTEYFGLKSGDIDVVMGTLSKALGSLGGYIAGSRELIDYLVNRSRPFIYTTALAPANVAAAREALKIIRSKEGEERRKILWRNVEYLKKKLEDKGYNVSAAVSPIIPLIIGDTQKAMNLAQTLYQAGIFVPAIRPPTVPKGSSRLRISLSAEHTYQDLDFLVNNLTI